MPGWVGTAWLVFEVLLRIVALGVVPANRRPSSSTAWLLVIMLIPVVGVPLFLLIGSPYVRGRRHQLQNEANQLILEATDHTHRLPAGFMESHPRLASVVRMNRDLTGMPAVEGTVVDWYPDYEDSIRAMTAAVEKAVSQIHVEIYIVALDDTTRPFFDALGRAVERGVTVRLLLDHLGSRGYPGYRQLKRRMTELGIDWHLMMPLLPLKGEWRRPDLRNHRKLMVVDDRIAFMGSQNMIDSSYLKRKNRRVGRHWHDLNLQVTGQIVSSLAAVFATDWVTETNEPLIPPESTDPGPDPEPMQLVPSGPGFTTEPNLRLFTSLIEMAHRRVVIVSPYFIPDEGLMQAITSARYRGLTVELYVSEKADQFMVHHAQRSYYEELLVAGVQIFAYPSPTILHAKFLIVDDWIGVVGSSNMDMRSFYLDYEVSLLGMGPGFAAGLSRVADSYRARSKEITLDEWRRRPAPERWLDNLMRMTSALQ